jgi:hypothetical protein
MMKVIKALAIGLLSLILFLSLFVFAITFTVKQTALNPDYAVKVIDEINFSQAIQEIINQQASSGSISPQLQTALTDSSWYHCSYSFWFISHGFCVSALIFHTLLF